MKHLSFFFKLSFCCFFVLIFSCNKENIPLPNQNQDIFYKNKVELLLHSSSPSPSLGSKTDTIPHFNFKTYRDAYNFLESFQNKQKFTSVDTSIVLPNSSIKNTSRELALQTITSTYSAAVNTSVGVSNYTWGTMIITLAYDVSWQIMWAPNLPPRVTENNPYGGSLYYAGFAQGTGNVLLLAEGANGLINGGVQGVVTVAGTSVGSFTVKVSGSWSFKIPLQPGGYSAVYTTLYATLVTD